MARKTIREILSGCDYVTKKKVANNTVEWTDAAGNTYLRLHETDIITRKKNGDVILSSGGWKTNLTKERLNENGYRISSYKKQWVLPIGGKEYVFEDGITIHADGRVTGAGIAGDPRDKVLRQKIAKYADGYAEQLLLGKIGEPSGDCFICMTDLRETDHLTSHMKEKYYVPTLLLKALKEFGASIAMNATVVALMQGGTCSDGGYFNDERLIVEEVSKYLRRYLLRRFGMPE